MAAVTERGDARRARLRGSRCASGSPCSRASPRPPSTRCTTSWCWPRARARWCAPCAGWATASPSSRGGFSQITDRLAADLGIHYARANELEIVDGILTGRIVGDVVDRAGKAAALRYFAEQVGVPIESVVAIGDGANDLDMLEIAGLGIAYNAKALVQEAADTTVNVPTSTRSCTCSASAARRSRRSTWSTASSPRPPRSDRC